MEVNSVYCPSGWSPSPIRHYDPNRKEGYYCFKNAGLSYGNIDLCPAEGGHRIWLPGNEVQYDLLKLLKGKNVLLFRLRKCCLFEISFNTVQIKEKVSFLSRIGIFICECECYAKLFKSIFLARS